MSSAKDNLPEIMELTREMLEMAETGAWDELIEIESRRGFLITQYFDAAHEAGIDASDAVCIQELSLLNDRILDLGKAQRQELMKLLSESNRQRHAATCYRQTRTG